MLTKSLITPYGVKLRSPKNFNFIHENFPMLLAFHYSKYLIYLKS